MGFVDTEETRGRRKKPKNPDKAKERVNILTADTTDPEEEVQTLEQIRDNNPNIQDKRVINGQRRAYNLKAYKENEYKTEQTRIKEEYMNNSLTRKQKEEQQKENPNSIAIQSTHELMGYMGLDNIIYKGANTTYEHPVQLINKLQGYEEWLLENNHTPSMPNIALYLGISSPTLMRYYNNIAKFPVYNIIDNNTNDIVFYTHNEQLLSLYIQQNPDTQSLIDNNIYSISKYSISYSDILSILKTYIENYVIKRAERSRNPSWWIFYMRNNASFVDIWKNEETVVLRPESAEAVSEADIAAAIDIV